MPSAQVPLWVPIAVGLLGLGGVLGAQLIAGWREDRRWRREVAREDLRWQRERERERERLGYERRYTGREQAYGRVIGVLEEWQWVLHPAKERVIKGGGTLDEPMRRQLVTIRDEAREALGPMNLHAPEDIRHLMRDAVLSKVRLTRELLGEERRPGEEPDRAAMSALYRHSLDHYYAMRTAMRRDLGIDEPD
ncbi:MAG TPA: hypothetical protein VGJ95_07805 [Pseudonocardiaceae bacterium]